LASALTSPPPLSILAANENKCSRIAGGQEGGLAMKEELRLLRARINLSGLTRKEAAKALYLSVSALNRKLRGDLRLTEEERARLMALTARGREGGCDCQGDA